MAEFRMPSLGADMEAGTLVEWMVKPGDSVKRGQVVAVVETQKGAIEVECWESGRVAKLLVEPGTQVPVGTVLAVLDGDEAAAAAVPTAAQTVAEAPPALATPGPAGSGAAVEQRRRRVSPAARRRAEELEIRIEAVEPGAAGATISIEDVERAAAGTAAPAAPKAGAPDDWRAQMRKAIAAAMSRSKREIPHYYLSTEIDVTDALAWLSALNTNRPLEKRLLPAAMYMKAVALALSRAPGLNGFWRDGAFEPAPSIQLGMAVAMRGGGLVAPAIHDADRKSLDVLMAALADLIARVRTGRLRSSELADPTVTLTSLGDKGVDRVYGVIYPPQVAIVGLGKVRQRPWCVDGTVALRQVISATLAADHRASDGHLGARFLADLEQLLGTPGRLQESRS
jgi:pyruvate dehydrogenase E2 component (dihydrolipoamide acetyltransferase)